MSRPDDRDGLPQRRHPHRLDADMYRMPDEIIFVTVCASPGVDLAVPPVPDVVVAAMDRMGHKRSVTVHAYCLMPDHLHVVVSVAGPGGDAERWVRYVKREVATTLHRAGMWQRSYWDRHARRDEDVVAMVEYTLNNPARRNLVGVWHEWPHSWSEWHEEARGAAPWRGRMGDVWGPIRPAVADG